MKRPEHDTADQFQIMLDPGFFQGPDEVGSFLAVLARQYARAFVQSGQAMDEDDALERIQEMLAYEFEMAMKEG